MDELEQNSFKGRSLRKKSSTIIEVRLNDIQVSSEDNTISSSDISSECSDAQETNQDRIQAREESVQNLMSQFHQPQMTGSQLNMYSDDCERLRKIYDKEKISVVRQQRYLEQLNEELQSLNTQGNLQQNIEQNLGSAYEVIQNVNEISSNINQLQSTRVQYEHMKRRIISDLVYYKQANSNYKKFIKRIQRRIFDADQMTQSLTIELGSETEKFHNIKILNKSMKDHQWMQIKNKTFKATEIRKELEGEVDRYTRKKFKNDKKMLVMTKLRDSASRADVEKEEAILEAKKGYDQQKLVEQQCKAMKDVFGSYHKEQVWDKYKNAMTASTVLNMEAEHLSIHRSKKELDLAALQQQHISQEIEFRHSSFHKILQRRNNSDIYFQTITDQKKQINWKNNIALQRVNQQGDLYFSTIKGLVGIYATLRNADKKSLFWPKCEFEVFKDSTSNRRDAIGINTDELYKLMALLAKCLITMSTIVETRYKWITKTKFRKRHTQADTTPGLFRHGMSTLRKHTSLVASPSSQKIQAVISYQNLFRDFQSLHSRSSVHLNAIAEKAATERQQTFERMFTTTIDEESEGEQIDMKTERKLIKKTKMSLSTASGNTTSKSFGSHQRAPPIKWDSQMQRALNQYDKGIQSLASEYFNMKSNTVELDWFKIDMQKKKRRLMTKFKEDPIIRTPPLTSMKFSSSPTATLPPISPALLSSPRSDKSLSLKSIKSTPKLKLRHKFN